VSYRAQRSRGSAVNAAESTSATAAGTQRAERRLPRRWNRSLTLARSIGATHLETPSPAKEFVPCSLASLVTSRAP
jgi:hypothetical protein